MQCPKCRAAMPNGAKYCTECGAKLPVQPDSVPNVPQPVIQAVPVHAAWGCRECGMAPSPVPPAFAPARQQ